MAAIIKREKCKNTKLPKKAKIVKGKPSGSGSSTGDGSGSGDVSSDGAIALCEDGTKSYASSHRGACSGHGGVKCWCDYATSTAPLCAKP